MNEIEEILNSTFEDLGLEDKKMKEIIESVFKQELNMYNKNKKDVIKAVNKLYEDKNTVAGITITNIGLNVIGGNSSVLTLIEILISHLIKKGFDKESLKKSINKALEGIEW